MHKTIIEYLHHHVAVRPDEVALSFLPTKSEPLTELTYKEFWFEALSVANFLKSKICTGDKVILLYPPNIDYVVAFYGCLLAGAIAVPAPLPSKNEKQVIEIANRCQPVLVLTTLREVSAIKKFWQAQEGLLQPISFYTTENSVCLMGDLGPVVEVAPEAPAFLRYFHDENSNNQEMIISHRDIIENVKLIPLISEENADDIFVGWLPYFNEMDLVVLC